MQRPVSFRLLTLAALVGLPLLTSSCRQPATTAKQPFGQLPSADTTAVPQWMPWRVRAGIEAPRDDREAHLHDLRQLSFGNADSGALWWSTTGRTLLVLRRDADCQRVYAIDLTREDRNPSEPLSCISKGDAPWKAASLTGRTKCKATPAKLPADCAAFVNGQPATRSPDRTRWVFRDDKNADGPRFTIKSLPEGRMTVLPALGARLGAASWLADGARVLVSSNHEATQQAKGPRSLYVLALHAPSSFSGSPPTTRITFAEGDHDHAALSPNGKHIAFVSSRASGRSGPHHVYVARWSMP